MIELGHVAAGNYVESNRAIYWDGRNNSGEYVSSGTYFFKLKQTIIQKHVRWRF